MTHTTRLACILSSLVLVAGGAPSPVPAADTKPVLRLHAFAVNMSGPARARAGTLDIVIERWSTDEEVKLLTDTLIEKDSSALLNTLQKIKPRVGYIRTPTSLGWDIHFAREAPYGDGGRRVTIATDRPMSFWELRARPRSVDYEFTLAEIRLGKDGKGEGKLVPAAKVRYNNETRTMEIEEYGTEPVRLTEVRAEQ
jgi:hypothetical protein